MLKEKYLIRTWLNLQLPTMKFSWVVDRHKYTLDRANLMKSREFEGFNKIDFFVFLKKCRTKMNNTIKRNAKFHAKSKKEPPVFIEF